mmetsp:Transcript_20325/g.19632  ORF Transcript_20325/g.19632 Transcript_20325/m.19632 type:complete len:371 (+) Transcript_20325:132-1244(+)|eukprot:CAMPEP_0119043722 /NCGR_PEP_ID=MMETSP1177-20130426/25243_1 /TAXON_ID=2985 /ORGANISM="Ochromonas sp, Strain CCMP1899" /LENGTH=370 /DNA_ID=CAMNT_0007012465 /DNA_START=54 /DNA_END=1166 /DNA_ORIENTATION=+
MERRKNQHESSIGSEIEFPTEDFDFDNRKKDSKLYHYTIVAILLIFFSFLFFSSSASDQLRARHGIPSEAIHSELDLQSNVATRIPVKLSELDLQKTDDIILSINTMDAKDSVKRLILMTELNTKCQMLIEDARKLKQTGAIMETDEYALKIIALLQSDLKTLLNMRFGENAKILVEMVLQFPRSMPDFDANGPDGKLVIELGPVDLVPYSVYYWLEIVRRFQGGSFHRRASHVLQAQVHLEDAISPDDFRGGGLAFQEYNKGFPHNKLTLGYAGRPGGPAFYISTVNNVGNHGPASQGSRSEADSCFGKVVEGEDIVDRMKKQPGAAKPSGFTQHASDNIKIVSLRLLTPDEGSAIPKTDVSLLKYNKD